MCFQTIRNKHNGGLMYHDYNAVKPVICINLALPPPVWPMYMYVYIVIENQTWM